MGKGIFKRFLNVVSLLNWTILKSFLHQKRSKIPSLFILYYYFYLNKHLYLLLICIILKTIVIYYHEKIYTQFISVGCE